MPAPLQKEVSLFSYLRSLCATGLELCLKFRLLSRGLRQLRCTQDLTFIFTFLSLFLGFRNIEHFSRNKNKTKPYKKLKTSNHDFALIWIFVVKL